MMDNHEWETCQLATSEWGEMLERRRGWRMVSASVGPNLMAYIFWVQDAGQDFTEKSNEKYMRDAEIAQLKLELQRVGEGYKFIIQEKEDLLRVNRIYESALAKLREQIDGARAILTPKGPEGA